MARSDFGGSDDDYLFRPKSILGQMVPTITSGSVTFWSAQSGGTQYTDLSLNGSPVTAITVGSDGQIPLFQGPDNVTQMWADAGSTRVLMVTTSSTAALVFASLARTPDALIAGAVTRDSNGAATSAPVTWPDGSPGTYTATTVSTAFPGAVDAYTITYGSPVTKTYSQPAITRNGDGAATSVPAIVVS